MNCAVPHGWGERHALLQGRLLCCACLVARRRRLRQHGTLHSTTLQHWFLGRFALPQIPPPPRVMLTIHKTCDCEINTASFFARVAPWLHGPATRAGCIYPLDRCSGYLPGTCCEVKLQQPGPRTSTFNVHDLKCQPYRTYFSLHRSTCAPFSHEHSCGHWQ